MNLKSKTDYCLRVLIYLQENPGKAKIRTIADTYNISKNHLSVVVNKLSELEYIFSTPGPNGGIEFNAKAGRRTVGGLISEIEELNIVECFELETNTCNMHSRCKLKKMLKKASDAFLDELKQYKICELI